MNFAFSPEQEMLRASAREFLSARYPIERVAALADGDGFPRREWKEIVDLGWTGISVPEEEGGAGLGFLEEMVLCEEMGRTLYPGPFLSTVVMAVPLVSRHDLRTSLVSGERVASVVWGSPLATDVAVADLILAVQPDGFGKTWLRWADRDGPAVTWRQLPTVDGTRPLSEVLVDPGANLPVDEVGEPAVNALRDRTLVALAAEAIGVGQAALDMAIAHAKTRTQFGKPIGVYQAVAHQLADAYMELETARSLTYWAGWAVAELQSQGHAAAAAARARAAEAATQTCERAIQVLGGMGFTWEHPLHRYYKRALGIGATLEPADSLWIRVADGVLADGTPQTDGSTIQGR